MSDEIPIGVREACCMPDIDGCDTDIQRLADRLGISEAAAVRVQKWADEQLATAQSASLPDSLKQIIAMLIPTNGASCEVVLGGLLAASGVLSLIPGVDSMESLCERLQQRSTCERCGHVTITRGTRAAISHWATIWADKLGLQNTTFCRDDETREKNRVARHNAKKTIKLKLK